MKNKKTISFMMVILLVISFSISIIPQVGAPPVAYNKGDVFCGVGNGIIKHFDPAGTLLDTLDTTAGISETTGMAFDENDNLYSTLFSVGTMAKFNNMGNLLDSNWGGPFSSHPESIVFDANGDCYVGEVDGSNYLRKFDQSGTILDTYTNLVTEDRGIDWIDLASDQTTLYYTSEGYDIMTYDLDTKTMGPTFATLPTRPCFALRIRDNEEVLVASSSAVYRLDSTGGLIDTYPKGDYSETGMLFALNLDPDGTSFWTAGYTSGNVYRIDIETGALITSFNAGIVGSSLAGLAIFGEPTAAQPDIETSIIRGIDYLLETQNGDGSWDDFYPVATTAMVLIKLQDRAYELGMDPFETDDGEDDYCPWSENIILGWEYVFDHMYTIDINPQPAGDPDTTGNGIGIRFHSTELDSFYGVRPPYETGIVLMALVASMAPDRPNEVDADNLDPVGIDTYFQIAQEVVDYFAWAQQDLGLNRGGWHYAEFNNQDGGSDQSVVGYVVLGLAASEDFGCTVPQFVKDELNLWIDYIQNDADGGSGYNGPNDGHGRSLLRTGNLIFQMTFVGDTSSSVRLMDAIDYITLHWKDGTNNPGWGYGLYPGTTPHYQAMYCLMKGLVYSGIELLDMDGVDDPEYDWFADLVDAILVTQNPDGSWPYTPPPLYSSVTLSTVWALLVLEKITPEPPEPSIVEIEKYYTHTDVNFNPWHWECETLNYFNTCPPSWPKGDYPEHWECSETNLAGGDINEVMFTYWIDGTPSWIGKSWIESPPINAIGFETIEVSFKQYVAMFYGPFTLGVEATNDGSTWIEVYSKDYNYQGVGSPVDQVDVSFQLPAEFTDTILGLRLFFDGDIYNIDYWYIDDLEVTGCYKMMDPAELGTPLNTIHMVINKNKVRSHNPGQFYSVINITGPVQEFDFRDDFDVEFNVHPKKIGTGGCQVILLDPDGYATVITKSSWVDIKTIDNKNNYVEIEFDFDEPLPSGYTLKIYIKYQTSYKQKAYGAGDGNLADDEFWNNAVIDDGVSEPLETGPIVLPITGVPT